MPYGESMSGHLHLADEVVPPGEAGHHLECVPLGSSGSLVHVVPVQLNRLGVVVLWVAILFLARHAAYSSRPERGANLSGSLTFRRSG